VTPSPRLLLAELTVASLLIYPSRQRTAADRTARDAIWTGVKQAKPEYLRRVSERLAELPSDHSIRQLIPANAILVPVPRSTPLAQNAVWPALQIAEALVAKAIGHLVIPALLRSAPVRRSTGARYIGDREPPLRHYETISPVVSWIRMQAEPAQFVLVDDVVTTGSTLIACASQISRVSPRSTVSAFAVARAERDKSLTNPGDMYSPACQTITLSHDDGRPKRV